jgi:hypothetical protein
MRNALLRRLKYQDVWAGSFFVVVGLAAFVLGRDLTIGTAAEMGEGYVPRMMAIVLTALGALIVLVAWFRGGESLEQFTWRPLIFVTGSIFAFAATLQPLGLVIAIAASVVAANWAGQPLSWRALATLIVVLSASVVAVFVWALGLPLPAFPSY